MLPVFAPKGFVEFVGFRIVKFLFFKWSRKKKYFHSKKCFFGDSIQNKKIISDCEMPGEFLFRDISCAGVALSFSIVGIGMSPFVTG